MEIGITFIVSLRLFWYWTGSFACGSHTCVTNLSKMDKNWQFWKIDLDVNFFDLQRLERSLIQGQIWLSCFIVSWIRNILVPIGSLYDNWFKNYADFCENEFFLWPWPLSDLYKICHLPCVYLDQANVEK